MVLSSSDCVCGGWMGGWVDGWVCDSVNGWCVCVCRRGGGFSCPSRCLFLSLCSSLLANITWCMHYLLILCFFILTVYFPASISFSSLCRSIISKARYGFERLSFVKLLSTSGALFLISNEVKSIDVFVAGRISTDGEYWWHKGDWIFNAYINVCLKVMGVLVSHAWMVCRVFCVVGLLVEFPSQTVY